EIHFGSAIAPGGFAWAVPVARPDGAYVRIGVMARDQPVGWFETMVTRLEAWGVERGEARPRIKLLPLRTIARTYADRLLVVGDAAGMVKPTTGGGIHYSIMSASLASDVAVDALQTNQLTAAALRRYQSEWRRWLSAEFHAQWILRRLAQRM